MKEKFPKKEEWAMRLQTWELLRACSGSYWDVGGDYWLGWLCADALAREFEIPHRVRTIWVSVYDKPAPDRLKVVVLSTGFITIEDGAESVMNSRAWFLLRKALGGRKSCYVGVQYR